MLPKNRPRIALLAFTCLAGCFLAIPLYAHGISASFTTVTVSPQSTLIEVGINVADAIAHFGLDADSDNRVSPQELQATVPQIATYLNEHLTITLDSRPVRLEHPEGSLIALAAGQELVVLRSAAALANPPKEVAVACGIKLFETLGQSHANFVKVVSGTNTQTATLTIGRREQRFSIAVQRLLTD